MRDAKQLPDGEKQFHQAIAWEAARKNPMTGVKA
jgi:hypothetical protein